ncbi:hypothetical protein KSP40_PGU001206 [Platanthera guangdongensis]|uniref:Gnk2-homologous domain-containing protein n=1 Tax=Platanthera guangdongensis TaxID=2320717 RepID=A0ABR2N3B9_9ASPA
MRLRMKNKTGSPPYIEVQGKRSRRKLKIIIVIYRSVCSAYLTVAAALNTSCPGNKSASVRNVYCVLRYADHAIASVLEYPSFSSVPSPENASNPALFGQQLGSMLSGILPVSSSSPVRIVGGVIRVDAGMNYTVYGFAWCMTDLLPENCYQCLDHALMSYTGPAWAWTRPGRRGPTSLPLYKGLVLGMAIARPKIGPGLKKSV